MDIFLKKGNDINGIDFIKTFKKAALLDLK